MSPVDLDCAKPFIGFCSALTCDACIPHNNRLISIRMHAQAGELQYTMCASLQVFEKITCLCVGMLALLHACRMCVCVCVELLKRSKTWTSTSPVKDFYMVFDFWYLAFGIWNHVLDLCSWILLAFGIWHMCSYQQRGKASSDDLA